MRSIQGGGFWILLGVLAGGLAFVLQGGPDQAGDSPATEQVSEELAGDPRETHPAVTPPAVTPPAVTPVEPASGEDSAYRETETRWLVLLVKEYSAAQRERVFRELKRRHVVYPLDVFHLLTLAALRGEEARRDDVRAIGDWARRQIESHKDRDSIVGPILGLALEADERVQGALLDVLDDLGRMRPRNVEAARAAFVHERATYRMKRSIIFLLPSVAEHALPMVVPLAFFRDAVVSGKAQTDDQERSRMSVAKKLRHTPHRLPPGTRRLGGYQREHLEGQIDALFAQMGAPALQELVRALRRYFRDPKLGGRAASGWTIYDAAIIEVAHLDVDLVLTMSFSKDVRERRLAAQALRELAEKSPDVERALRELREDSDRLVREFAKRS